MADITIILESKYFDKPPNADIYINDKLIETVKFEASDKPVSITFACELADANDIIIHRYGKTIFDTIVKDGNIISDQTLSINNIIVNRIPLEKLLYLGVFYPDYPEPWHTEQKELGIELPTSMTYHNKLFHNGRWILNFEMPIHVWFFNNINKEI